MDKFLKSEIGLFVSEADRLSSRSFYRHFVDEGDVCFSNDSTLENTPTLEQLESYLLHFRKFLQKNDRVCIHRIDGYIRQLKRGDDLFLREWSLIYNSFKNFGSASALTGRVVNRDSSIPDLTLLELFKVRTFGDLSHIDRKKNVLHRRLSSNSRLESMYRFEYYGFLFESGELIVEMASLCRTLVQ